MINLSLIPSRLLPEPAMSKASPVTIDGLKLRTGAAGCHHTDVSPGHVVTHNNRAYKRIGSLAMDDVFIRQAQLKQFRASYFCQKICLSALSKAEVS